MPAFDPAGVVPVFERDLARAARTLVRQARPSRGASVLVVLPDRTRPCPLDGILPALFAELDDHGLDPARVTVAIASGTHVASDLDVARLGELPAGVRLLRHDATGPHATAGSTPRGTEVRVDPALLEADAVLAIGPVVLHYFAGFGGGGKMLFPGLGERASIAANHRLSLAPERGLAAGVEPGRTAGNPVAEDLRAAHLLLPRAHHLSLVEDENGWSGASWSEYSTFDALCRHFAAQRTVGERHAADLVYAHRAATDLVQAHKILFHAALYAKDGATVVLDAYCPERIGSPSLARWLASPDRATLEAEARSAYDLNAQTAISLAAIAERVRVMWSMPKPLWELARWGIGITGQPAPSLELVGQVHEAGGKIVLLDQPWLTIPHATAAL